MDTNPPSDIRAAATTAFERDLEELVLSSFGRGAAVDGEWNVVVPVSAVPNWGVTIEKRDDDRTPSYEPTLLDD